MSVDQTSQTILDSQVITPVLDSLTSYQLLQVHPHESQESAVVDLQLALAAGIGPLAEHVSEQTTSSSIAQYPSSSPTYPTGQYHPQFPHSVAVADFQVPNGGFGQFLLQVAEHVTVHQPGSHGINQVLVHELVVPPTGAVTVPF